jgi:hypothetical protein
LSQAFKEEREMTTEQLKRVHQARPFSAFLIFLADGREIRVNHPENLNYERGGRTFQVVDESGNDEVIDLLLVVSLKVVAPGVQRNGR